MPIPKVIHYCWFGRNPLPEKALACIESWKKFCPDYEIKEWNEDNFDFSANRYAREAYEAKKWAFVSDYARLAVLYTRGGIYMDTDVEVVKPLDEFLADRSFIGFEGGYPILGSGILGAEAGHPWIGALLQEYEFRRFIRKDGALDTTANTDHITAMAQAEFGMTPNGQMQMLREGVKVYPTDWLAPKDWRTGEVHPTDHTHTIHHYTGSWCDPAGDRFMARLKKLTPLCGEKLAFRLAYIYTGFEKHGLIRGSKIAFGRLFGGK